MNDTVLTGREDKIKLRFEYGAYLKVIRFAKAGAANGSRGVLLGDKTENGAEIKIALEALYSGDEGLETPSFTKESWARILNEIQQYYPNMKILGQYSTHLNTEVSEQDSVMQKSFFADSESFLFVFDPLENREASYEYKNGKFRKLEGVYLYDVCGNNIDLKLKESLCRNVDTEYQFRIRAFDRFSKKLNTQNTVYSLIAVLLAMLLVYSIFQNLELKKRVDEIDSQDEKWEKNIEEFEKNQKRLEEEIEALNKPEPSVKPSSSPKPGR